MFTSNQFIVPVKRISSCAITIVFLTQCSGADAPKAASAEHLTNLSENTVSDSYHTATSPLDDFGLREEEIPQVLKVSMDAPYASKPKINCPAIKAEITALDAVLGPDVDAPKTSKENAGFAVDTETILDRGGDLAHETIVGFVKAQTSFLPFRGVIRTITGAKHHEKEVSRATQSGKLRRAYLKGMLHASGKCEAPAIKPGPHIQEAGLTTVHQ
ncbi:MAG: hypothetical protein B7X02_01555 [Rhodospirillales bacterium 12-54-5]|nr:MAG: hypothetical protein B7X02_01555 [Rhodospirillales bacterium 12-54-5]